MTTPYLRFGLFLALLLCLLAWAFDPGFRCGMSALENLPPEGNLHVDAYGPSAANYLNQLPAELPTFPGVESAEYAERAIRSQKNLAHYLRTNINEQAIAGKRGRVGITFTVDQGGEVREVSPTRLTDPALTVEVMRVFGLMQGKRLRWNPGKIDGKTRAMELKLQLSFGLRCSDCEGLDQEMAINQIDADHFG
ncbi:energy transducer TonB [Neolewinella agarilytica]|uniref:energy transducer TonB n=1 Tax=Neolewinella agarilytica TaxID=478744 RepID=UPI0023549DC0|nr:hypothetical protein [Neolewinella agarilytica]